MQANSEATTPQNQIAGEIVDLVTETEDITPETTTQETHAQTVMDAVNKTVRYCEDENIINPVEIIRCFQNNIVLGRKLEILDLQDLIEGETNFIMVDRASTNVLSTAFEEINCLTNLRTTLEVQFYGEVSILLHVHVF